MSAATPLLVACAVIRRGTRTLWAQRADNGLWELPGGKLEPGEDLAHALAREIAEELGCQVEVGPVLDSVRVETPRPLELWALACRLPPGQEPRALEHRAIAWLEPDQARDLLLCAADRRLLQRGLGG